MKREAVYEDFSSRPVLSAIRFFTISFCRSLEATLFLKTGTTSSGSSDIRFSIYNVLQREVDNFKYFVRLFHVIFLNYNQGHHSIVILYNSPAFPKYEVIIRKKTSFYSASYVIHVTDLLYVILYVHLIPVSYTVHWYSLPSFKVVSIIGKSRIIHSYYKRDFS